MASVSRAKTALGVFLRTNSVSLRILPVEKITPPTGSDENSAIKWKWSDKCICNLGDDANLSEPPEHRFTKVFGPEVGTPEIYHSVVKPIVVQLERGNDGIVMCYGPSKSGKSHTIQGILPLAAADLLQSFAQTPGRSLSVSVLAIYDEKVLDLLSDAQRVTLEDTPDARAECVGLCKKPIASVDDLQCWLDVGKDAVQRHEVSRSHIIVQLILESGQSTGPVATMSFIDLAGGDPSTTKPDPTPEELVKNRTMSGGASANNWGEGNGYTRSLEEREENNIRLSLMALNKVVKHARRNGFVPFRASRLTRLLSSMWSPKTNMTTICTVNPIQDKKTRSTLEFAGLAKRIAVLQSSFKEEVQTTMALHDSLKTFSNVFGSFATAFGDRNEDDNLDDDAFCYKQMMKTLAHDMLAKLTAMVGMGDDETPVVNHPGVGKPSPSKQPLQAALGDLRRTSSVQGGNGRLRNPDEVKNDFASDFVIYLTAGDRLAEFAKLSADWIGTCQATLEEYSKSASDAGVQVEKLQKLLEKEQLEMQASQIRWSALVHEGQMSDERIAELNRTIEKHRQDYTDLKTAIEQYYEEKMNSPNCFRALWRLIAKPDPNYRPWNRFMPNRQIPMMLTAPNESQSTQVTNEGSNVAYDDKGAYATEIALTEDAEAE